MKNTNKNKLSSKKNIRFEHELINEIDKKKGSLIPFSAWVKQACREKLDRDKCAQVRTKKPHLSPKVVKPNNEKPRKASEQQNSANKKRADETIKLLLDGISSLDTQDKRRIINSRYPKNELYKSLNERVSKDSIRKYWDEAFKRLKD